MVLIFSDQVSVQISLEEFKLRQGGKDRPPGIILRRD
jgi:hypothetical protein